MDPATIYAITVTLVGIGLPPKVDVEPLPPQWTMADCIKDHENKLAGKPNTMARCVSRDRPFISSDDHSDDGAIYAVGIVYLDPNSPPAVKAARLVPQPSIEECKRQIEDKFANRRGMLTFCVRMKTRMQTCSPHTNQCLVVPS